MPNGGTLKLSANISAAPPQLEAPTTRLVVFHVEDSGVVIPTHVLAKIFDTVFSTKETGKGTGFGLSTSLTIVRSHAATSGWRAKRSAARA